MEAAEDANVEGPEESELAAEQSQEENALASRARRPRKARRDRERRHRRRCVHFLLVPLCCVPALQCRALPSLSLSHSQSDGHATNGKSISTTSRLTFSCLLLKFDCCRGLVDGTQRREEATDIEDEEEEEEEEEEEKAAGSEGAAAGEMVTSSMPAVATSPQSSLAEPPGFSPGHDGASASFALSLKPPNSRVIHWLRP